MTHAAVIVGWNMVIILAGGIDTVMTGSTVVHDTGMIKDTAGKTGGAMAHAAIFSGGWMIWRLSWNNAVRG